MTDKLAQEQETKENESVGSEKVTSARNNRRKLLKGAVALPVVMTLQSGAALARTSNLVSAFETTDEAVLAADAARSSDGSLACFTVVDSETQNGTQRYDLGAPPMEQSVDPDLSLSKQADACRTGGGIIVSTNAFNSITGGDIT